MELWKQPPKPSTNIGSVNYSVNQNNVSRMGLIVAALHKKRVMQIHNVNKES
jgi:hypothetical protein